MAYDQVHSKKYLFLKTKIMPQMCSSQCVNEPCCRYCSTSESIPSDVQKSFYSNAIHTEDDFIRKGLSFVNLPISLPINLGTCDPTFLEKLQSKLDYYFDDLSN